MHTNFPDGDTHTLCDFEKFKREEKAEELCNLFTFGFLHPTVKTFKTNEGLHTISKMHILHIFR